jgi:hypothetical protein
MGRPTGNAVAECLEAEGPPRRLNRQGGDALPYSIQIV